MNRNLILAVVLLLSAGCTFRPSSFVCSEEGSVADDGRTCQGGVWVSDNNTFSDVGTDLAGDATSDGPVSDMASDVSQDSSADLSDGGVDMAADIGPLCGNNVVEFGEQCDDGGITPGDGCDGACQLEVIACGNGVLEFGEVCDDGDTIDNLCNADCQGFAPACVIQSRLGRNYLFCPTLETSSGANAACNALGYRLALVREDDDRAFLSMFAGGRPAWWIEGTDLAQQYHWTRYDGARMPFFNTFFQISNQNERCARYEPISFNRLPNDCAETFPYICEQRLCGNGTVDTATGETCDDGNVADDDGCSSHCDFEQGFECALSGLPRTPTICHQCGDGQVDNNESCDDGNVTPGDGCDAACQIEAGFVCSGGVDGQSCAVVGSRITGAVKNVGVETTLPEFGVSNASYRTTDCDSGFLTGIFAQFTINPFIRFRSIRGICGDVDPRNKVVRPKNVQSAMTLAGDFQIQEDFVECPAGQFVVGYRGYVNQSNGVATGLELVCAEIVMSGQTLTGQTPTIAGSIGNVQSNVLRIPQQTCASNLALSRMTTTTNDGAVGGTCTAFEPTCSTPQTCQ